MLFEVLLKSFNLFFTFLFSFLFLSGDVLNVVMGLFLHFSKLLFEFKLNIKQFVNYLSV